MTCLQVKLLMNDGWQRCLRVKTRVICPLKQRRNVILVAGTLLCVIFILLSSVPGLINPIPPALRIPFVLVGVLLLPGYLLDELLHISGDRVSLASPAIWFALSCGLLAPAGWFVLGMHTSLKPFGLMTSGLILLLLILVVLIRRMPRSGQWDFKRQGRWLLAVATVLLLTTVGIAIWAPRTADDWSYGSYLREYVDSESINRWNPSHGEGIPVTPRMTYNVWLVTQSFLAMGTGLDPSYELLELLDPILVVFALFATYTLAKGLFGSPRQALAVASFQTIAFLLSAGFTQPGQALLSVITGDKRVAALILLPVAWYLTLRIVERRERLAWWGLAFLATALVSVHAEVYMLLLISCGLFFLSMLLFKQPRDRWMRLLGIIAWILPWSAFVIVTALNYTKLGPAPGGPGWDILAAANAAQKRVLYLGDTNWFVVAPKFILYPISIIGIIATPLLLRLQTRKKAGAALLFANQAGALLLLFMPGLPNLMALFTEYNTLWRITWIMLPAFTLAYVVNEYWSLFQPGLRRFQTWYLSSPRLTRTLLTGAAGISLVLFWLSLVLVPVTLLHRDVIGRPARQWIPSPGLHETLAYAAPAVALMDAPVVLASKVESYEIPSNWPHARVLVMRGIRGLLPSLPPERQEEGIERLALVASLPNVEAESALFERRLDTLDVDLIVLNLKESAEAKRSLDRFPLTYLKVMETATHAIYLFNRDTESLLGAMGRAQLAFARGDQAAACEQFPATLQQYPQSPLAAAGVGLCQELDGDVASALQSYQTAMEGLREDNWKATWPAEIAPWTANDSKLATELSEGAQKDSLEFVLERLRHLQQQNSHTDDFDVIWIGGWPHAAIVQPAETLRVLETNIQPGSTFRLYALVEATGEQAEEDTKEETEVAISIMQETDNGLEPGAFGWLRVDTLDFMDIKAPETASGRLWLTVHSQNKNSKVTWFGWRSLSPEEVSPLAANETARGLSKWLSKQAPLYWGYRLDTFRTKELAQALLSDSDKTLRPSLIPQNLVNNPGLHDGEAAGWNRIGVTPDTSFSIEHRLASVGNWVAVQRSDGQGYQGGWCQTILVEPGEDYLYLVEAQADLVSGGKASIAYWDYQRFGQFRSTTGFNLLESTDWTFFWKAVHVPAGVRTISVCPALLTNAGTVRFDNIWFIPLKSLIIP